MIRLPIDNSRADLTVDLDDDYRSSVRLVIELEDLELTGARRPNPAVDAIFGDETTGGPKARRLTTEEGMILFSEVLDLRRRYEQLEREREVYRDLLPDEARALAAMLAHYADEAER